jgi:thioesterase domain-containing protein
LPVECVQAILDPKSEGLYLVAGYSAPGTLALEIAHQLHVREADVGLPALMGTYFPGYPRSIPGPLRQID